ncbi:putative Ig domain-containing protein, partial [Salinisphaera sp. G21_0]|uniref:putative Ig domain-containing protein n=1 Tax=Salinisphaera sp. G21_0 TaxID=2821094 RepID=UPI001ADAFAF7
MNSDNNVPVIGYVTDATSAIEVTDSNGNIVTKKVGDPIFLDEVINNESGSEVVVKLLNGQSLTVPVAQQVVMGAEIVNSLDPTAAGEEGDQDKESEESDQTDESDQIKESEQVNDSPTEQSDNSDSTQSTSDQSDTGINQSRLPTTVIIEQENSQNTDRQSTEEQSKGNELSQLEFNSISQLSDNQPSAPESIAPVIESQNFNVNENVPEDGSTVVGQVIASQSDNITFAIIGGNEDNAFAIKPTTGELLVTGPLNHETRDSYNLTVEVTNQNGLSKNASISVFINDLNEAPEAHDDVDDSHENHVLIIDVLANDVDADLADSPDNFNLHSAEIVDNLGNVMAGQGSVSIVDNRLQFTPGADFDYLATGESAVITIHYIMSDDGGMTSNAITTITVTGANDGPVLDAALTDQSADQDNAFSYQLPADSFSDLDGDALSYSATLADGNALPAWLSFDAASATFSGTPGSGDVGSLAVTVTASDGLASASDNFSLTIAGDPAHDPDVSQDLQLDTNLVRNGDLGTSDGWTLTGTVDITDNKLVFNSGNAALDGVVEQVIQGHPDVNYTLSLDYG